MAGQFLVTPAAGHGDRHLEQREKLRVPAVAAASARL
jgi:hypothetical protein